MKIRYTETALAEVDQIFSFVAKYNRSAAIDLRDWIERTVEALAEIPEMAQATDDPGVRRMPVTSYPYVIFYTVEANELVVLHVRHGARRPPTGMKK